MARALCLLDSLCLPTTASFAFVLDSTLEVETVLDAPKKQRNINKPSESDENKTNESPRA
jgi:hypothetical protein